ncbi:MAG: hypothetical protein KGO05_15350, partial [Chloroflexota bacterium]|nr:hypothetical protein [Chloroflexota bacterium]
MRRARGRPHARRIAWRDVRGFAQVIYYRRRAMPIHAYILDGESERFIWLAPPAPAEAEADSGALTWDQCDNARRLVALVERHTRLPLLDISDAVSGASGGPSHSTLELSLAERALSVARSSGDHNLARALLERLRPAGPFSRVPRGLARVMVWCSLLSVGSDARARLLVTTRALLPYYPYPERPDAPIPRPLPPEARALTAIWLALRQAAMTALAIACLLPFLYGVTPAILNRFYAQPLEVAASRNVTSLPSLYFATLTSPTVGWPTHVATAD